MRHIETQKLVFILTQAKTFNLSLKIIWKMVFVNFYYKWIIGILEEINLCWLRRHNIIVGVWECVGEEDTMLGIWEEINLCW